MLSNPVEDLIVIAADRQMERTIRMLLTERCPALGIPRISFQVRRHPQRDPGCRSTSIQLLGPERGRFRKAMVMFDLRGSGEEDTAAPELEAQLEEQLNLDGWRPDGGAVIVIEPELEAWLFGASLSRLERTVRWNRPESMRDWLRSNGYLSGGSFKPQDPKAAFDAVSGRRGPLRSGRLYEDLARNISLARCQDRAFQKFRATLQRWFQVS
jgi:hypothetical protein